VLDEALEERIAAILRPLRARWPHLSEERSWHPTQAGGRARGRNDPRAVGTAPGLVVAPLETGRDRLWLYFQGRKRAPGALGGRDRDHGVLGRCRGRTVYDERMLRLYGLPESEIAETLRIADATGVPMERLEVTTCLRRGEIEIVTRFEAPDASAYDAFAAVVRSRHGEMLFSEDFRRVDDQVAEMLVEQRLTVAVAESCTGGLLAGRLSERPGSSEYLRGGIVAYSNEIKESLVGVDHQLLAEHGAVSGEVALALADGARERLGATIGVGVTVWRVLGEAPRRSRSGPSGWP